MTKKSQVEEILAAAHINPMTFEAELGLLVHKWITLQGLDHVIEEIDHMFEALVLRQDIELKPPPSGE